MLVPKGLSSKKTLVLAAVLIITLGVIFYLVYTNFISNKSSTSVADEIPQFNFDIAIPEAKGFNVNFFENPIVRLLKSYASLPLTVGQVGRADLFGDNNAVNSPNTR